VDLVIWNEDHGRLPANSARPDHGIDCLSHRRRLKRSIRRYFVRSTDQISEEDRILIQTVAHVIITDRKRDTGQTRSTGAVVLKIAVPRLTPARTHRAITAPIAELPERNLIFYNGLGGFTPDGREYVISTVQGQMTPAPWVNVLANPLFGTVVSESGMAYTWAENAHEFRLTPWYNDPVSDRSGGSLLPAR